MRSLKLMAEKGLTELNEEVGGDRFYVIYGRSIQRIGSPI